MQNETLGINQLLWYEKAIALPVHPGDGKDHCLLSEWPQAFGPLIFLIETVDRAAGHGPPWQQSILVEAEAANQRYISCCSQH